MPLPVETIYNCKGISILSITNETKPNTPPQCIGIMSKVTRTIPLPEAMSLKNARAGFEAAKKAKEKKDGRESSLLFGAPKVFLREPHAKVDFWRLGSTDFSDRGLDCFTPAKINSNGPSLGLSYYGIFMGKEGYSKTIETPFGIGLQWSGAGSSGGEKGRKENKKSSIQEIDLNAYNPLQFFMSPSDTIEFTTNVLESTATYLSENVLTAEFPIKLQDQGDKIVEKMGQNGNLAKDQLQKAGQLVGNQFMKINIEAKENIRRQKERRQ